MDRERRLLVLYVSGFVCSLVSSASLTIPWLYWDPTLNTCINVNCGCILYSVITFNTFVGGAGWFCRFAVFGHLPILAWAAATALFHAYRICIPQKEPVRRRTVTFNDDGSRKQTMPKRPPPTYFPLAVLSVVVALLLLAQAWITTAGYYATCREYRKNVSNLLNLRSPIPDKKCAIKTSVECHLPLDANGNLAQLVFERFSCGTVLDFLDFLQPDPPLLPDQYRRTYILHTAYYLQVAFITSWLDCIIWVVISFHNIYFLLY